MKGLEQDTGKRLSVVMRECIEQPVGIAVLAARDTSRATRPASRALRSWIRRIPTSSATSWRRWAATSSGFTSEPTLIGTEIGAAAKNVIGLAAGMLDGFGYESLKGPLMARGAREVARLISAMGATSCRPTGCATSLGDYEATLFSKFSNNRAFGERFVRGEPFGQAGRGVYTVKAMVTLGEALDVELPISHALLHIVHEGRRPQAGAHHAFPALGQARNSAADSLHFKRPCAQSHLRTGPFFAFKGRPFPQSAPLPNASSAAGSKNFLKGGFARAPRKEGGVINVFLHRAQGGRRCRPALPFPSFLRHGRGFAPAAAP